MKPIIASLALVLAGTTAQAATVTYDLTGPNASLASFSQTTSGLTVTAVPTGGNIRQNNLGFGVIGNPNQNRIGLGEAITFTFSAAISGFSALIYETGTEDERFGVTINGTSTNYTILGGASGASVVNFDFASLFPTTGVTTVRIFGREPNSGGNINRGILINAITATTVPVAPVTPVPLPASGLLLLGAFGAMALRRR